MRGHVRLREYACANRSFDRFPAIGRQWNTAWPKSSAPVSIFQATSPQRDVHQILAWRTCRRGVPKRPLETVNLRKNTTKQEGKIDTSQEVTHLGLARSLTRGSVWFAEPPNQRGRHHQISAETVSARRERSSNGWSGLSRHRKCGVHSGIAVLIRRRWVVERRRLDQSLERRQSEPPRRGVVEPGQHYDGESFQVHDGTWLSLQ